MPAQSTFGVSTKSSFPCGKTTADAFPCAPPALFFDAWMRSQSEESSSLRVRWKVPSSYSWLISAYLLSRLPRRWSHLKLICGSRIDSDHSRTHNRSSQRAEPIIHHNAMVFTAFHHGSSTNLSTMSTSCDLVSFFQLFTLFIIFQFSSNPRRSHCPSLGGLFLSAEGP